MGTIKTNTGGSGEIIRLESEKNDLVGQNTNLQNQIQSLEEELASSFKEEQIGFYTGGGVYESSTSDYPTDSANNVVGGTVKYRCKTIINGRAAAIEGSGGAPRIWLK